MSRCRIVIVFEQPPPKLLGAYAAGLHTLGVTSWRTTRLLFSVEGLEP